MARGHRAGLLQGALGDLLLDRPNFAIAALFYFVHAAGIVVFAIPQATGWTTALLYGALFGFFVYAAYDLTNLATLRGWSTSVALIDLAWGTAATAVATAVACSFCARSRDQSRYSGCRRT